VELTYPSPVCDRSPTCGHHFIEISRGIWQCTYCCVAKWLPGDWEAALVFSQNIGRWGVQAAYRKALIHRPDAVKILIKLGEEMEDV